MAVTNILLDCTCSMSFCASDIGSGSETYAGPISFKADKVSPKRTVQTADHSAAQDAVEMHRKTKVGWEMSVEMKASSTALLAALMTNELGQITVTAAIGSSVVGKGVIVNVEKDYAGPSTLRFGIRSHGVDLVFS